jgi:hypothetical protein
MRSSHLLKCILFCSLVGSSAALAATDGTVHLSGTVDSTLSMTATDTTGTGKADDLDLSAAEQIAHVSNISMTTNNAEGLTLSATSGNLGNGSSGTIAFQVTSVADGTTEPAAADFTTASGTLYTVDTGAAGTFDKDLYILYTPTSTQDPGTYTATIDLSVEDN